MPCSRQRASTGVPASDCFNIANIWLSLYLDFFMQNLLHTVYEKILLMNSVNFRGDYRPICHLSMPTNKSIIWSSSGTHQVGDSSTSNVTFSGTCGSGTGTSTWALEAYYPTYTIPAVTSVHGW